MEEKKKKKETEGKRGYGGKRRRRKQGRKGKEKKEVGGKADGKPWGGIRWGRQGYADKGKKCHCGVGGKITNGVEKVTGG